MIHLGPSSNTHEQALCTPDFNISGTLVVNCEEHFWLATLDVLHQVHSGSSTHPTPDWTMIRTRLTRWSPVMHPAWAWPQLCPILTLPTQHVDEQNGSVPKLILYLCNSVIIFTHSRYCV